MQISNALKNVVDNSAKFARSLGSDKLETEHLLFGILLEKNANCVKILNNYGVTLDGYKKFLFSGEKNRNIKMPSSVSYSREISNFFSESVSIIEKNKKTELGVNEILYFMLLHSEFKSTKILANYYKLNIDNLKGKIEEIVGFSEKVQKISPKKIQKNLSLPENLKQLGFDLTKKIRESNLQKIIGRDRETEKVIEILCRKTKNNPVLIGEPGVGKSSIIEGLAQRINSGDVPEILSNKIIFSFDVASLVSGTKFRGSMEQKLKDAISTIQNSDNLIVFIDEIHTLVQAGSKDGEISPADILKPYLARGELHCIGATTTKEYKDYIEKDPALERRFQPVKVDEPTEEDTIRILKGIRYSFEEFHNVKILDEAIESAVRLSSRYITNRFLPDKAIDLIDEACSKIRVNASIVPDEVKVLNKKINELEKLKEECWKNEAYLEADKCKKTINDLRQKINVIKQKQISSTGSSFGEIGDDIIREVISSWTNIPLQKITMSEKEKLLSLENIIKQRVIGQEEAISVVCKAIRRSRAGIGDPNRPIGSFLFLGPTGVGKTELTKALGDVMFDDENAIVRFDMSEFKEAHSISRLIGSPPGYVGHEDGGELTEQVRKNPYTIVLFDEIEKAHPDIFNILLQIFDDGRLTDSSGKLVNFKNTILILTSNNGVSELLARRKFEREHQGQVRVNSQEFLMDKLRDKFKPELINRIDSIVIFDSLTKVDILKIADIMLKKLQKRLAQKNIRFQISDKAKMLIAKKGYDEEYGARPLRRVIDKEVNDVIAEMIITGKLSENSAILIDELNGNFDFRILC